jgi:hypothetical protein
MHWSRGRATRAPRSGASSAPYLALRVRFLVELARADRASKRGLSGKGGARRLRNSQYGGTRKLDGPTDLVARGVRGDALPFRSSWTGRLI